MAASMLVLVGEQPELLKAIVEKAAALKPGPSPQQQQQKQKEDAQNQIPALGSGYPAPGFVLSLLHGVEY